MEYNTLKLESESAIARLTLNRPDRANAMTMEMGRELALAMEQVRAAPQVRVLVVSGAGKHFCAGADMRNSNGCTRRRVKRSRTRCALF